ncbi:hypothetical protein HX788_11070 [Pseudomonas edaphica]|uniref:Uncharacterized protein n=2 Tax=Pseudomonas TaxID=286 RepID=A0A7Y8E409_9PSED|nr:MULTISPECIES: hypothetical protein [Pseudomonas]NWC48125.1 hypothetical protein [Pseudomonas sp. IPO3747]NWE07627.1 hypothetical protein [Pseudomonas edaphica]NWE81781.1 hypothetical protein [Pseudomonas edaphica]
MNKKFLYCTGAFIPLAAVVYAFPLYVRVDPSIKFWLFLGVLALIVMIMHVAAHLGALADNKAFLEAINRLPTVRITHRLTRENLIKKMQAGVLMPYPAKRGRLPEWFAHWMDGKHPATWVSIGKPEDVSPALLGSVRQKEWPMAISFHVPSTDIVMPPGFLKHLYGCYQQRLLNTVKIPHNADLYKRVGKNWQLLSLLERQALYAPVAMAVAA